MKIAITDIHGIYHAHEVPATKGQPRLYPLDEDDAPVIPRGLDFHCETAFTQARMACRKLDGLQGGREADELLDEVKSHLVSVIEQLEEIAAKLKAAKEAA